MIKIISTITLLCCSLLSRGQLFQKKNFMPGVKTVKGKYFSGTGSRGFWSEEKLDSLGRTIERSSYRKKKLTGTYVLQYNDRNDIILRIDTYDINHPGTADTSRYEYSYNNDIIAFEIYIYTSNDSAIYKLINNEGDSILTYQYTSYHNLADRKNIHSNAETYVLSYKNNLLTKLEITNNKNEKEISEYTYYPNGNVKRRAKKGSRSSMMKSCIPVAPAEMINLINIGITGRVGQKPYT